MEEDMSYVTEIGSRSIFETASSETNRFRAFFTAEPVRSTERMHSSTAARLCEAVFKKPDRNNPTLEKRSGVFFFEKNTAIWRTGTDGR